MTPERLAELRRLHGGGYATGELLVYVDELRSELDAAYHRLLNPCDGKDCEDDGSAHCHACPEAEANRLLTERDAARAQVADYENRITWHTTCGQCATVLDRSIAETERAEKAEAERDQARQIARRMYRRWISPRLNELANSDPVYADMSAKHVGLDALPDWLTESDPA